MIGFLQGVPQRVSPERVLLGVAGVGYELHIPLSTYYEIERRGEGAEIGLFVHTHVREDALELFGFWTEREKLLFEKLITVSGIGPRLARVTLSGMSADELLGAIAAGDSARLVTIPGIGKKTAERVALELRDKVQGLAADLPAAGAPSRDDDLVAALLNLGYKKTHAESAVTAARAESPDAEFHELLRASLARLSRA
jgi:Holliday junction DNA helicase RuvA